MSGNRFHESLNSPTLLKVYSLHNSTGTQVNTCSIISIQWKGLYLDERLFHVYQIIHVINVKNDEYYIFPYKEIWLEIYKYQLNSTVLHLYFAINIYV